MSAIDKDSLAPQLLELICKGIANGGGHERYMPQGEVLERCLTLLERAEKEVLAHLMLQLLEQKASYEARIVIAKAQGKL